VPTHKSTTKKKERFVAIVTTLGAHVQAVVLMQRGEGAFDHPPMDAQLTTMQRAPCSYYGLADMALPN
jgi:hypothetical protein